MPLTVAPMLWVSVDLWSQYVFRVPWDLLGYSQVGDFFLIWLAPWTGVNGITFVLIAVNSLLAAGTLIDRVRWLVPAGLALSIALFAGNLFHAQPAATGALAVRYGFREDLTFYTLHGDLFAFLCAGISLGALAIHYRVFHSRVT